MIAFRALCGLMYSCTAFSPTNVSSADFVNHRKIAHVAEERVCVITSHDSHSLSLSLPLSVFLSLSISLSLSLGP